MERFKSVKIASILGITMNLLLLIGKAIVGFVTHSQAMIADAFNSAGDIFSSLMTFIGNKIASRPSDDDHNLGHGKAEYIYSMLISIAMFLMSCMVFKDSVFSIIQNKKYNFSIWLIIVCLITIIIKFYLYLYTKILYKKNGKSLVFFNLIFRNNLFIIIL